MSRRTRTILRLLKRDGSLCWLCGERLLDDMTIEHLKARHHGGSHRIDNLALTHESCNQALGTLPVDAKLELRYRVRAYGGRKYFSDIKEREVSLGTEACKASVSEIRQIDILWSRWAHQKWQGASA